MKDSRMYEHISPETVGSKQRVLVSDLSGKSNIRYKELKKNVFAYNALAEGTLANIAEAQDRNKSEQGVFLKDLQELYSHVAGSQGINPCVRILKINAGFSQWIAEAKHVSSPDTIKWDSSSGSSLKKG